MKFIQNLSPAADLMTAFEKKVRFAEYNLQQNPACYSRMAICKLQVSLLASYHAQATLVLSTPVCWNATG